MPYVEMTPENVESSVRTEYQALRAAMKIVARYECPTCHSLENNDWSITHHLLGHAIDARIAVLWQEGRTLKEIEDLYHVFGSIVADRPESDNSFLICHHNITKDNCFKISHLQCCDYPAYRITEITNGGKIYVWGIGSWDGGYRSAVSLGCLRDPRPLSELYVDKRAERRV